MLIAYIFNTVGCLRYSTFTHVRKAVIFCRNFSRRYLCTSRERSGSNTNTSTAHINRALHKAKPVPKCAMFPSAAGPPLRHALLTLRLAPSPALLTRAMSGHDPKPWNYLWKPGPYPTTKEAREAAARKYVSQ